MDAMQWDDRYAGKDLVWSAEPNAVVEQETLSLTPGRALDLAAGEGRNAIWLASRGWQVTAVDFSSVATERARRLADERLGADAESVQAITADVLAWEPEPGGFDLVLIVYFHVPAPQRRALIRAAARGLAPDGTLLVLGHHRDNIEHGVGGPQDPALLFTPEDVVLDLDGTGLSVERSETQRRPVTASGGTATSTTPTAGARDALDAFVRAHRSRS